MLNSKYSGYSLHDIINEACPTVYKYCSWYAEDCDEIARYSIDDSNGAELYLVMEWPYKISKVDIEVLGCDDFRSVLVVMTRLCPE